MGKRRSWWDLVDDEHSGRVQTAKVWLHIGNTVATYKLMQLPAELLSYEMLGAYLAVVTLGYGGMYWLTGKRQQNVGFDNEQVESVDTTYQSSTTRSVVAGDRVDNTQDRRHGSGRKRARSAKANREVAG